jgi:2,3-dihydroxyphenylpropionate 1,2-dioxygenase
MAQIQGFVAMSHSPFWNMAEDVDGTGANFAHAAYRARALVKKQAPDALVIFGPDHFRNFFYDVMPSFCIGFETVEGFGDYGTPKGPLPVAKTLGRHIYNSVIAAGFDPAYSLKMGIDHGISQPYAILDAARTTPFVPIMINAAGAPRPSLRRCFEFGKAVGEAIRKAAGDARILIAASGGLSHWVKPVSADDPRTDAETLDYVVNGRPRAEPYSAARDASVQQRAKQGVDGNVNADWDQWFINTLIAGDFEPILAINDQKLEETAGNGAHELRTWIAAASAWGGPIEQLAYEPVRRWVSGMGCVGGFNPGTAH